jgi:hypothetical protein
MRAPAVWALLGLLAAFTARAESYYLIVGGLGGEPRYDETFARTAQSLAQSAARTLNGDERVTVLSGAAAGREALTAALASLAERTTDEDTVAIFLIGHGSFDGDEYKFNLPGPDIDGAALASLFGRIPAGQQILVNTTSASGAVLETWAADGRTVITATRSGGERNATRFAEHWAQALASDEADANKNGAITLQEAFDFAARKVTDSFQANDTLATEHPQIAGDAALGFNIALLSTRIATSDQLRGLLDELASLEAEIGTLRGQREQMASEAYLDQLQALLLELALVQREIDAARGVE